MTSCCFAQERYGTLPKKDTGLLLSQTLCKEFDLKAVPYLSWAKSRISLEQSSMKSYGTAFKSNS